MTITRTCTKIIASTFTKQLHNVEVVIVVVYKALIQIIQHAGYLILLMLEALLFFLACKKVKYKNKCVYAVVAAMPGASFSGSITSAFLADSSVPNASSSNKASHFFAGSFQVKSCLMQVLTIFS
jgi:hypothetical protein